MTEAHQCLRIDVVYLKVCVCLFIEKCARTGGLLQIFHVAAELRDVSSVVLERLQLHFHVAQTRQRLPLHVEQFVDARLAHQMTLVELDKQTRDLHVV